MRPSPALTALLVVAASAPLLAQESQPAKTPPAKSQPAKTAPAKTAPAPATDSKGEADASAFPRGAVEKVAVTLTPARSQPGDVLQVTDTRKVVLTTRKPNVSQTVDVTRKVEITVTGAENDGTVTSLGVRVLEIAGDGQRGKALAGTTYEVERAKDGSLRMVDSKQAPVTDLYTRSVLSSLTESMVGDTRRRLAANLPTTKLKPGAKVEFESKALLQLLRLAKQIKEQKATYRGTRTVKGKRLAVFDLRFTTPVHRGQSTTMGGEVLVNPQTGQVELIDLRGRLTIRQGGGPVTLRRAATLSTKGR